MFGTNDPSQTSNDDPAMLDNVKDLASKPTNQVEPNTPPPNTPNDNLVGFQSSQDSHSQSFGAPTIQNSSTDGISSGNTSSAPEPSHPQAPTPTPPTPSNDMTNASSSPQSSDSGVRSADPPQIVTPTNSSNDSGSTPASDSTSPAPSVSSVSSPASSASSTPSEPADLNKLADMKKQALDHLEPLSEHIDGDTPEETFKRTMMMIQANDNHTLLDKALDAAKEIKDDKERAQALLDIINEINYFSQANSGDQPAS